MRLVWRRKVVSAHGHWDDRGASAGNGPLHARQVEQLGVLPGGRVLLEDEKPSRLVASFDQGRAESGKTVGFGFSWRRVRSHGLLESSRASVEPLIITK